MKEVNTQNLGVGTGKAKNIPIWIIISFQQRERPDSQKLNKVTSYRPPVTSGQWLIGTEKYRDSAVSLNYGDDDYPHGYGQIKESFKALTKDVILQPYLSDNELRSTNEDNGIGFNSYIFGIQYPKTLVSAHSIKVEFKVSGNVSAGNYGYALVLTNKLVSISTDGQRHFDLI